MALVLPDAQNNPTHPGQALIDNTDLAALLAAFADPPSGWKAPTAITGSGTAMSVICGGGTVIDDGVTDSAVGVVISSITVPTYDRRDIVTWDAIGGFRYIYGTECTVVNWTPSSDVLGPVKPPIPSTYVLYGEIYVVGGASVINTADCVDKTCPVVVGAATPPVTLLAQAVFTR